MKKERHLKTIRERFGVDLAFENKDSILAYQRELVEKIRQYRNYNYKKDNNFKFDLPKAMIDLGIDYKGIFYLRALGEYGDPEFKNTGIIKEDGTFSGYYDTCDAYFFQYDDTPPKRVNLTSPYKKGDKEYMEYTRYYVMKVSVNGWTLVFFTNWANDLDYVVFKDNDMLIQGNMGTLLR